MLTQVVSYPKRLESVHVRNGERYIAWSTDTPKVEDFKEIPGMVWQPEIEARLEALSSPFRTAEAFKIEEINDPREARPMVSDFVEMAQPMLATQLGPSPTPYMP